MFALPTALVLNLALGAPPLRGPDFDGDGREDAAVSAVLKSVDGEGDDGAVLLLYGTSSGLAAAAGKTDQIDQQQLRQHDLHGLLTARRQVARVDAGADHSGRLSNHEMTASARASG